MQEQASDATSYVSAFFFCYDDLMQQEKLESLLGSTVKYEGMYTLRGKELAFTVRDIWGRVRPNLEDNQQGFVQGTLYKLTRKQLTLLEALYNPPDFPLVYTVCYHSLKDGESCFYYMSRKPEYFTSENPALWTILSILRGAKRHGLRLTVQAMAGYLAGRILRENEQLRIQEKEKESSVY